MSHRLFEVLSLLDDAKIHYRLDRFLPDAVTITVSVVGGRHEINVNQSGEVLTSSFSGDESLDEGIETVVKIVESNRD